MFGQQLAQISSNSEMVELEPFVELTRNDPTAIIAMWRKKTISCLKLHMN